MSLFKRTNARFFAKPSQKVSADTIYWKQLNTPTFLKEFGPINYIDFSPVEPHYMAVSCSAKVQIYNPITKLVHKTLSNFSEGSYGGNFRGDGQLLVAGSEEGAVKLFDFSSINLTKHPLRLFKGHSSAVHRCFFTSDHKNVASFSDDKTVGLWDIAGEALVSTFSPHEDYCRAGAVSPVSPALLLSGSYDRKLRLFDTRTSSQSVFTVDHGHPVEAVLFLPSGGIFISAGGTEVRVWDALSGGRLLARLSPHHKTVTCLSLASSGSRLLSGSLDRHVKFYDVSTYKVVHNIDHSAAILSLGTSANDETLAVGSVDGVVSIRRRDDSLPANRAPATLRKPRRSQRYFEVTPAPRVDTIIKHPKKRAEARHDICLRKFEYSKALDKVLAPYVVNKNPHVTVSLLQELIRRKGLENALYNRDEKSICAILRFLLRYICEVRFTGTLIDVANQLLATFEEGWEGLGQSRTVVELLGRLKRRLEEDMDLTNQMLEVAGIVRMLRAASAPPPPASLA